MVEVLGYTGLSTRHVVEGPFALADLLEVLSCLVEVDPSLSSPSRVEAVHASAVGVVEALDSPQVRSSLDRILRLGRMPLRRRRSHLRHGSAHSRCACYYTHSHPCPSPAGSHRRMFAGVEVVFVPEAHCRIDHVVGADSGA